METWAQPFWESLTPNTDPAPFPALGGGRRAQLPWHLCSPPGAFTFFSPVFSSWPVSLPLKSSASSPARFLAGFLAMPPVWALSPTGLPDGLSLLTSPCSPAHGPSYALALCGSRICRADLVPSQFTILCGLLHEGSLQPAPNGPLQLQLQLQPLTSPSLCSFHTDFPFLRCAQPFSTSRPLHVLFPLPGMSSLQPLH